MGSRKKVRVSLNRITGGGRVVLVSNVILSLSLPGNWLSAGSTAPLGPSQGTAGIPGRTGTGSSRMDCVGKGSAGKAGPGAGKDDTGTGNAGRSWGTPT